MAFQNSIAVLDVGHGNCAVIDDAGAVVVVDAGRKSGLLEFLEAEHISVINAVLLSHADADHIGGLLALINSGTVSIGEVRVNTDSVKDSELWDDVLWSLEHQRREDALRFNVGLTTEDTGLFDQEHVAIEILGPSPYLAARGPGSNDRDGNKITHNTISAVIRITWLGEPVALLAGDLDEVGLSHLLAEEVSSEAPVLVFPHHGGSPGAGDITTFTTQLIDLVSPSLVVFSIGRNGAHRFPRPEIVARLRTCNPSPRIVCTQLSKHCANTRPRHPPDYLGGYSMGAQSRNCCGGTIIIPLENAAAIVPDESVHRAFISEYALTALCAT